MNTKIIFAALCLIASGTAFSSPQGEDSALLLPAFEGSTLTRAEVKADLDIWTRAGVPQYINGETGADFNSSAYREAYVRYLNMRKNPVLADGSSNR